MKPDEDKFAVEDLEVEFVGRPGRAYVSILDYLALREAYLELREDIMSDYLAESELEIGSIYKIHSRNLAYGVWTGVGFIGIREKFGDKFLFEEYLWKETSGTARPIEKVAEVEDDRIFIREVMPFSVCSFCGANVEFINQDRNCPPEGPFYKHLVESPDCDYPQGSTQRNWQLYRVLERIEDEG